MVTSTHTTLLKTVFVGWIVAEILLASYSNKAKFLLDGRGSRVEAIKTDVAETRLDYTRCTEKILGDHCLKCYSTPILDVFIQT